LDVSEEVPVLDALPLRQERRRPGRISEVSPALIPLLRDEGQPTCDHEELREHDLAPATGILDQNPFRLTISSVAQVRSTLSG
jgi:hypothetical protein